MTLLNVSLIFTALLMASKGFAFELHTVKTTLYGNFEFSEVSVADRVAGNETCLITGRIDNKTDGSWTDSEFTIKLLGAKKGESLSVTVAVGNLPFQSSGTTFSAFCYRGVETPTHPPFEPVSYVIVFEGGYREPGPLAARKEALAARMKVANAVRVRRETEAAAARVRADFLAKFPTIQSGFTSAFIGSDKKCAAQFLEAVAMEGLEKRKRLADLITFGCGFITGNTAHASVDRKEGTFAFVNIIDGDKAGKSGWVPTSWIK